MGRTPATPATSPTTLEILSAGGAASGSPTSLPEPVERIQECAQQRLAGETWKRLEQRYGIGTVNTVRSVLSLQLSSPTNQRAGIDGSPARRPLGFFGRLVERLTSRGSS